MCGGEAAEISQNGRWFLVYVLWWWETEIHHRTAGRVLWPAVLLQPEVCRALVLFSHLQPSLDTEKWLYRTTFSRKARGPQSLFCGVVWVVTSTAPLFKGAANVSLQGYVCFRHHCCCRRLWMLTDASICFENTINSLEHCKEHMEWKKKKTTDFKDKELLNGWTRENWLHGTAQAQTNERVS